MVLGPTCGLVLGDLGAEVIKVEPVPDGDNTRRLSGMGAGFWPAKVVYLPAGTYRRLVATADVVTENFRPALSKRSASDAKHCAPSSPTSFTCR